MVWVVKENPTSKPTIVSTEKQLEPVTGAVVSPSLIDVEPFTNIKINNSENDNTESVISGDVTRHVAEETSSSIGQTSETLTIENTPHLEVNTPSVELITPDDALEEASYEDTETTSEIEQDPEAEGENGFEGESKKWEPFKLTKPALTFFLLRIVFELHHSALNAIRIRHHILFTILYIYMFPFIFADAIRSAASITWILFLIWFLFKGTTDDRANDTMANFRLLAPLCFVFESM